MLATPTPTTALALWIAEPAVPPRRGTVPGWRSPRRRCMRWTRRFPCSFDPTEQALVPDGTKAFGGRIRRWVWLQSCGNFRAPLG
jgi:hypothetical protein